MSQPRHSPTLQRLAVLIIAAVSTAVTHTAAQLQIDRTPFDVFNRASTKGTPTAKFVVVEFSDYECPFCARHARHTLKQVETAFVETGRIQYVLMNFPIERIHQFAVRAAQAAECAGRAGKFWQMHELLFANESTSIKSDLRKYAAAIDLDLKTFEQCLSDGTTLATIRADAALAAHVGVRGTPTFILGELKDGRVYPLHKISGAVPFPVLKSAIEELLNGKMKSVADASVPSTR